ncbi:sensor domain-containing diguanylate cyclase [Caldibacillus debilis]|uniref:sensor domain-containing diguanylate cyclase n=1 Tax=Caldibacillus debilis TaxID=301148 RepID=UPI000381E684|nr:sensor domain-containing diguanylate cyclase [Caldibacillus debilis]
MVIGRKKKWIIWLAWAVVVPASFLYASQVSPLPSSFNAGDFIILVLLMIPAALLPVIINQTPISFTQWIVLVVFLQFGLLAEMILTQFSILITMIRLRLSRDQYFRFPLNSAMFSAVSVLSGTVYYLLGGTHNPGASVDVSFFLLAFVYVFAYYLLNQLFFNFIHSFIYSVKISFFSKDLVWETLSLFVAYPIGVILYILYNSAGNISVLLVGIPVILMLLVLHNYNRASIMNEYLQKAVELGHRLTEKLKFDEVLEIFVKNVLKMFPANYLYILEVVDDERLEYIRCYEKGEFAEVKPPPLKKNEGIGGLVWSAKRGMLFHERREWQQMEKEGFPDDLESLLAVPMMKNNRVTGVILLGSKRKRVYDKFQLAIFDILCSYLAISLDNAKHYEKTKDESIRCPLTKLYNARYFHDKLEEIFEKLRNGEMPSVSLLLIDIDHFKMVNDTYGHQSGNEILCQMADLLKSIIQSKGIVARYGGEEFAVILPGYKKEEASSFAEYIRKTIESRSFVMYNDLAEVRRKLSVRVTVSIGVSAAPADTDEPMALLRCADRALYIGAKRVGRNKVAKYVI